MHSFVHLTDNALDLIFPKLDLLQVSSSDLATKGREKGLDKRTRTLSLRERRSVKNEKAKKEGDFLLLSLFSFYSHFPQLFRRAPFLALSLRVQRMRFVASPIIS